ncbi:hypothetical protein M2352_001819 [Azospirillum fermentarium]|uniref:transglycosylase SLT domain-containing protein n=1 Tax=Azospirillum fermentarium TaxID=1233114 RepID=UPI0022273C08|nr:transglycosylase SLT domain-containing protein [Azospirillum fermentarium]MCW2246228.1 hypothetical protein [Azospirillum fermentarium]
MTSITSLARQSDALLQRSQAGQSGGTSSVESAIRNASSKTGVDFAYLMAKASQESSFDPNAKASTSSATGLYQFIDSTWLTTVKAHGADNGLGKYANAIQVRSDGRATVSDPAMKQEILDLRKNPSVSALMAAEFTRDNKEYLEKNTNGPVGATELYMAHFLGAGGAAKFLNAKQENPNAKAADLFPEAASANKAVFYDKETGQSKTLAQIYNRFAGKFSDATSIIAPAKAATDRVRNQDMPDGFTTQVPSQNLQGVINGHPLSIYQVLALNALETPDETTMWTGDSVGGTSRDSKDKDGKRMRDQPVRTDQTDDVGPGLTMRNTVGAQTIAA